MLPFQTFSRCYYPGTNFHEKIPRTLIGFHLIWMLARQPLINSHRLQSYLRHAFTKCRDHYLPNYTLRFRSFLTMLWQVGELLRSVYRCFAPDGHKEGVFAGRCAARGNNCLLGWRNLDRWTAVYIASFLRNFALNPPTTLSSFQHGLRLLSSDTASQILHSRDNTQLTSIPLRHKK
jgi:hypothetical protein